MSASADAVNRAIAGVTQLRTALRRVRGQRQVRGRNEKDAMASLAHSWFERDRPPLSKAGSFDFTRIDAHFSALLELSERNPSRSGCVERLDDLRDSLIALRTQAVAAESLTASRPAVALPAFNSIVSDPAMQAILTRRWKEIERCLGADANLAAIVMMGGLLEALLMARINQLSDKAPVFTAKAAPRDKNQKTLQQKEWTLNDYIEIARELKWIGETAKSVGVVLRDYRNYIHPYKELTEGVTLTPEDAAMLWTVFVTLTDQILRSAARTRTP